IGYGSLAAIADMNNDGSPDVLVGTGVWWGQGPTFLLLGHGDGTFEGPVAVEGGPPVTDVNGDGNVDLVSGLALGRGDGTFVRPAPNLFFGRYGLVAGHESSVVADVPSVADLDGDGFVDLVARMVVSQRCW